MLSEKEREQIREAAKREILRISEQIRKLESKISPVSPDCSLGRLTRLEAMGEKAVNEELLARDRLRLLRLDNTLKRLDEASFGLCIDCEEPIPLPRLLIRPESLRCVACASDRG